MDSGARMRSVDDVLTGAAQTTEDGAVGVVQCLTLIIMPANRLIFKLLSLGGSQRKTMCL